MVSSKRALVVEGKRELRDVLLLINRPDTPTVDLDSVMGQVFGAISVLPGSQDELYAVAAWMASGEGMYEGLREGEGLGQKQSQLIFDTIVRFGEQMREKLINVGAYRARDKWFKFQYREVINNDLFIFDEVPEEVPDHHYGNSAGARAAGVPRTGHW